MDGLPYASYRHRRRRAPPPDAQLPRLLIHTSTFPRRSMEQRQRLDHGWTPSPRDGESTHQAGCDSLRRCLNDFDFSSGLARDQAICCPDSGQLGSSSCLLQVLMSLDRTNFRNIRRRQHGVCAYEPVFSEQGGQKRRITMGHRSNHTLLAFASRILGCRTSARLKEPNPYSACMSSWTRLSKAVRHRC